MEISKFKLFILLIVLVAIVTGCQTIQNYPTIVSGEKIQKEGKSIIISEEETQVEFSESEMKVLELVNEYRKENGLKELKPFNSLSKVAKIKAEDIVKRKYFAHNSPVYGTPFELIEANGLSYKIAGENLAGNISSEKAVEAWINSESHRDNILEEKFQYTGICVVESEKYGKVFVQMFIGI